MNNLAAPDYWRQLGIVSPSELAFPIHIIGAGGTGSPTALFLAKMGCSDITLWDFDNVEAHNFPNQTYRLEDIDKPKAVALAEIIRSFTGTEVKSRVEKFENQDLSGVVITCVDNMSARADIWKKVRLNMQVPLLIDPRMGGLLAKVYALKPCLPDHIRSYEGSLHSDEEATETICTEQAIIYNTLMIASIICAMVKCFAKNEPLPLQGTVKLVDMPQLLLY